MKSTVGRTLAWVVATALVLGGCVRPSQEELDSVREALDASGLCIRPVNVEEASEGEGTYYIMFVHCRVASAQLSTEELRSLLRVIYDNTPEGFEPITELAVDGRNGDSNMGPALVGLGFLEQPEYPQLNQPFSFRFHRSELDDLFS